MKIRVYGHFICPWCQKELTNCAQIIWGAAGESYEMGQKLRWYQADNFTVNPNTYYGDFLVNYGSPVYNDVLAFDVVEYSPESEWVCRSCSQVIGGLAIKIVNQIIQGYKVFNCTEIRTLLKDEDENIEVFILKEDTYVPYKFPDEFGMSTNTKTGEIFKK